MPDHIGLFGKICGQIASSGKPAAEEEKLDWFIESVNENSYEPVKAHCNSLKILGTLQFAQMIKLYALTCFAKYPQFQLRTSGHKDKDGPVVNASSTMDRRGRKGRGGKGKSGHNPGKGRGQSSGKGRGGGRGKGKGQRYHKSHGRGHNTSDEKTTADKTKTNTTYNASSPAFKGECSYCGIYGHMSRDCQKRIAKETKGETTAHYKHTRVTAASVTFDADDDDETEIPDDCRDPNVSC